MERLLRDIYDAIGSLRQRISYLETQDGVADLSDAMSFVQLTDSPSDYIGQSGKIVAVTAGEDGLEFVVGGGGVEEFTDLTDTPENYTGHGGKVVAVNVGETGLEFVAGGGALADHDHSGDAGDGGTFDAANLTSGAATDGYVLTADGSGGAAWEVVSGGASELDDLTDVDLTTPPSDGQALVFDSGSSTWKAETLAGGVTDFLDLTDTPASYTYSLAPLRVNNSGDGVEDVPGIRLNATSSTSASILIESELSRFTAITKSNSLSSSLTLYRYRGSVESALAVEDGDVLGDIGFYGSPNGTNVVNGAEIRATVDGTVTTSPSRVPAKLAFRVVPAGGGSAVERVTLRSSGHVGIDQTEPEDKLHVSGAVALDDITTPSTPSSDTHKIYAKSDGIYVINSAGTEIGPLGTGGGDENAIHDDESGEVAALDEKSSPVSADLLLIEDSEDGNTKKKVQIGNLPVGGAASFSGAQVRRSDQPVASVSTYTIPWNFACFDTDNYWDDQEPSRLTAPVTGYYQISMRVDLQDSADTDGYMVAAVGRTMANPAQFVGIADSQMSYSGDSTGPSLQSTGVWRLEAGDYIELTVTHYNASGNKLVACGLTMYFIGA